MRLSNKYIAVEPVVEEPKEGFTTVAVQDSFVYKGRVLAIPEAPVFLGNQRVSEGDIVIWAKYSPDTHEIEEEGKKIKYVAVTDLIRAL